MSPSRRLMALVLIALSVGLLYPGVTQPALTLTGTIEKSMIAELGIEMIAGENADAQTHQMLTMISGLLGLDQVEGQLEAYSTTRSIIGTAEELATTGNIPVAFLIVFFSILIPLFKLSLQAAAVALPYRKWRARILWLNGSLSKWSMADVFVMALLVAYMAGAASGQMGDMLTMDANLETGFWYFLAYCVFSILAGSLIQEPQEIIHEV